MAYTLSCPYSLLLEASWIMDVMATMGDLEDGGLVLRTVKQKKEGAWVSNDYISMDCSPLLLFSREKGHYVQLKRTILIHLPSPTIPFRYFLEVLFNQILTTIDPGPQQHFIPYHSFLVYLFLPCPDYNDLLGFTHQIHSG